MRLRKINVLTLTKEVEDFIKIRDKYNEDELKTEEINNEYIEAINKLESKYLMTDDAESMIDFFRKYKKFSINDLENTNEISEEHKEKNSTIKKKLYRYRGVPNISFNSESPKDLNTKTFFVSPLQLTPRPKNVKILPKVVLQKE
tara:strand:- start:612 stop:1046 length:435 start_codon:yes stop_codon:yes gene_type:complete